MHTQESFCPFTLIPPDELHKEPKSASADVKSVDTSDKLSTTIVYFSRDKKYDEEKPYTTSFSVELIEGAKVDNHEFDHVPAVVQSVRGRFAPKLDVNGFCFVDSPTRLKSEDFDNSETVTEAYYSELAEMIHRHFPRYRKVSFFDHAVRRRLPHYPAKKGTVVPISQPFRYAHVDFTEKGALMKLRTSLSGDVESRLQEALDKKCDILKQVFIWRLLSDKPTRDWPLAWCDPDSIDADNDLIANDVVYPKGLGETIFLRSNPQHKWWYLGGQRPQDVAVFRNICLGDPTLPRGFHCAFFNPEADDTDELRSSIEVRVAAWY